MSNRLECYVIEGRTLCIKCSERYTGSVPTALEAPRTCSHCEEEIKDPWPESFPDCPDYPSRRDLCALSLEGLRDAITGAPGLLAVWPGAPRVLEEAAALLREVP